MNTLNPLVTNAYTNQGNRYKKSNLAKTAAVATVLGTGMFLGAKKVALSKPNMKDITESIKKQFKNVVDNMESFTKDMKTKLNNVVNKENLKQTAEKITSPKVVKIGKYIGIAAGILALGAIVDFAINKYNSHKADKV